MTGTPAEPDPEDGAVAPSAVPEPTGDNEATLITPSAEGDPVTRPPGRDPGGETVRLQQPLPAQQDFAAEREVGGQTVRLPPPMASGEGRRSAQAGWQPPGAGEAPAGAGEAQDRASWDTGTAAWDFLTAEREQAELKRARQERRMAERDQISRDRAGRDRTGLDQSGRAQGGRQGLAGSSVAGVPGGESPEPVIAGAGGRPGDLGDAVPVPENELQPLPGPDGPAGPTTAAAGGGRRKVSSASALIGVLLALFGFTLVVQLRSNDTDQGLATARQEDLVRILSDLEARDTRLSGEISALEQSQRQLTSGVAGRQAALAEAEKRADELGLLAGTLPGRGPGLKIVIDPKGGQVKASAVLNAVQELRGAGGEVMELAGADGTAVRIVASTYFVDAGGGGIVADGAKLTGPYTLWVIGAPQTMQTALQIPGGVVASVESAGGSVTMEQSPLVEVAAVRRPSNLQYARPVS